MNFELRFIGEKIVELKANSWSGDATLTEDVADLFGDVKEGLIENLRDIAEQLEEYNKRNIAHNPKVNLRAIY